MPSAALRLRDLRAIHELGHECRDLGDDHTRWREHWFRQLARLTGAELVVGGDAAVNPDESVHNERMIGWGWENGFDRTGLARALTEGGPDLRFGPHLAAYFRRCRFDGSGRTRTDLLTDREWYSSPYFRRYHAAIGVDHVLLSFLTLPGRSGECSAVTLSRGKGVRRDFNGRARALVRETQVAIGPLIGGALARFGEPSPSELPPRTRDVLRCLLEGDSDKQAATRLGISKYTVNQYVKVIFDHFGVATRAELLARWVRRGWGNGFAW